MLLHGVFYYKVPVLLLLSTAGEAYLHLFEMDWEQSVSSLLLLCSA